MKRRKVTLRPNTARDALKLRIKLKTEQEDNPSTENAAPATSPTLRLLPRSKNGV